MSTGFSIVAGCLLSPHYIDGRMKLLSAFATLATPVLTGMVYADESAEK
ncbi:MAG: hypothetical protein IIC10_01180 [Proteobacteria bacterium]|nr:hypothetical protein [Pseudomonadota bacterium]